MADTIYFNDGTSECIFGNPCPEFEQILRDKLGDDAASYFRGIVSGLEESLQASDLQHKKDELISDGWYQRCIETRNSFYEILETLRAPRLNKRLLIRQVQDAYNDLNQYL